MLERLDRSDRMRLMKFVCSFAWADLEVRAAERAFVAQMIRRLDLDEEEKRQVREWLEVPPEPDAVDPARIPREQRELFIQAVAAVAVSDGEIAPEERENLELLRALLV